MISRARLEKLLDVEGQVGGDVVGVVGELGEVEPAGVVEGLLGDVVEHGLDVGELAALEALDLGEHVGLRRLEHAVEAAQHRKRQDDAAVLCGLVGAAEQVGNAPDEADLVAEAVHLRYTLQWLGSSISSDPSVALYCTERNRSGTSVGS